MRSCTGARKTRQVIACLAKRARCKKWHLRRRLSTNGRKREVEAPLRRKRQLLQSFPAQLHERHCPDTCARLLPPKWGHMGERTSLLFQAHLNPVPAASSKPSTPRLKFRLASSVRPLIKSKIVASAFMLASSSSAPVSAADAGGEQRRSMSVAKAARCLWMKALTWRMRARFGGNLEMSSICSRVAGSMRFSNRATVALL